MSEDNRRVIICSCHSPEHQFIINYFDDEDEVYLHIHLTPKGFFRRILHAIKYIFGYRSKYGDFDEIVLHNKQINEIMQELQAFKNRKKAE